MGVIARWRPTVYKIMHEPLTRDHVLNGVIYLKGETRHPIELVEALAAKANNTVMDFPVFDPDGHLMAQMHRTGQALPFRASMHTDPINADPRSPVSAPPVPVVPASTMSVTQGQPVFDLPDEVPFRDILIASGYTSVQSIISVGALTEIPNIEEQEAQILSEWLNNNYVIIQPKT